MAVFRPGLFQGGFASMSLRALLYRRPSEPSVVQVVFDKAIYLVRLRRHRQARRYTLRIDAAVARGGSHHAAARQREGSEGIRAEARRLDRGAAQAAAGGDAVRARGRGAAARRAASHRASPRRARHGVDRDRRQRPARCFASRASRRTSTAASAISSSARRSAISTRRAARYAAQLGVPIKRICVRDQSSRWGSCSNTGVLSFSWRLILAPPFVLDYLAAHEVSHLVELNHSPRFWRLVKRLYPQRRARQGVARRATAPICIAMGCPIGAAAKTSEPAF